MHCMKCGVELKNSGVFCENCLADMEKYPVKPNITIQLPNRPATSPARKRSRRNKYPKPEDQIRHLKKVRNWLFGLLIAALLALAGVSVLALHLLDGEPIDIDINIGQNYGTVDATEES